MAYVVLLSEQSKTELAAIKKSGDKATIKKIANMLVELQEHPRSGTGQVEHLRHFKFEETWNHGVGSPDHIQESDISMLYYLSHSHFI